jgi:hypothetical protein
MPNFTSFLSSLILFLSLSICAYSGSLPMNTPPYAVQGILATDKVIDSSNVDTQTDVRVCTAKNGWVFAAYIRSNGTASAGVKIRRSKDNGESWKNVCNITQTNSRFIGGLDMVVCGNDSASLVLYLISVENNLNIGKYTVFINKYDANTGALLANCYTEPNSFSYPIMDCAITSDFLNPSIVSSPYSIGAIFSLRSNPEDSIIFVYSIDGGNTFTRQVVDTTDDYFGRVSIAYGKSLSQPNGKYFVAYEEKDGINTQIGNIRTCHNQTFPGSPFTRPFAVDTLVGSTKNVCSYPSIACQIGFTDNDSSDLTTVIMVERDFNGQQINHDVLGFVNKNSNGNHWERFNVLTGASSNAKQPRIVYDFVKNFFLATYWDSTTRKLVLTYKDINFSNPNTWTNLINQYNDTTSNIEDAKPYLSVSPVNGRTNFAWISGGKNVEGVAYFDSFTSMVGSTDLKKEFGSLACIPNPSNHGTTIRIQLNKEAASRLEIKDIHGKLLFSESVKSLQSGSNEIFLATETLPAGLYFIQLISSEFILNNKLIISHP